MNDNLVKCTRINVNCAHNDPVDIKCGGPEYLGFDFNVKEEQAEEMKKFIIATLEIFEVPLISIYASSKIELNEKYVWTKERIVESIKKEAKYLQKEANRNYGTRFRR